MESASIDNANHAIKALLLLNGGASLALLSFLSGSLQAEEAPITVDAMLDALVSFATGAGIAVLAAGLAYLANSYYAKGVTAQKRNFEYPYVHDTKASKRRWTAAILFNNSAIVLFFVSLGCFAFGVYKLVPAAA